MKWLLGLIILYVLGSILLSRWPSLGMMEKIWVLIFIAILVSALVPGLRPLAVKLLLVAFFLFFLMSLYDRAKLAYQTTTGNLRATASYMALDLWNTGKNWLGSLKPSLFGPDTLLDMAGETQKADAAYVECLSAAVTELDEQNLLPRNLQLEARSCLPKLAQDAACMTRVKQIISEANPYQEQRCAQHNALDRARAGIHPFANILCIKWLPEALQDKLCLDRQGGASAAGKSADTGYQFDENRVRCLFSFAEANSMADCNQYTQDLQQWEQCIVTVARSRFGDNATPYLRQCGAIP